MNPRALLSFSCLVGSILPFGCWSPPTPNIGPCEEEADRIEGEPHSFDSVTPKQFKVTQTHGIERAAVSLDFVFGASRVGCTLSPGVTATANRQPLSNVDLGGVSCWEDRASCYYPRFSGVIPLRESSPSIPDEDVLEITGEGRTYRIAGVDIFEHRKLSVDAPVLELERGRASMLRWSHPTDELTLVIISIRYDDGTSASVSEVKSPELTSDGTFEFTARERIPPGTGRLTVSTGGRIENPVCPDLSECDLSLPVLKFELDAVVR